MSQGNVGTSGGQAGGSPRLGKAPDFTACGSHDPPAGRPLDSWRSVAKGEVLPATRGSGSIDRGEHSDFSGVEAGYLVGLSGLRPQRPRCLRQPSVQSSRFVARDQRSERRTRRDPSSIGPCRSQVLRAARALAVSEVGPLLTAWSEVAQHPVPFMPNAAKLGPIRPKPYFDYGY